MIFSDISVLWFTIGAVTIFAGSAAAVARWSFRFNPSLRHTICVTGLILVCAVPTGWTLNRALELDWLTIEIPAAWTSSGASLPERSVDDAVASPESIGSATDDTATPLTETAAPSDLASGDEAATVGGAPTTSASVRWITAFEVIYLLGVLFFVGRLLHGMSIVGAARRDARPFPWSRYPTVAARIDRTLGPGLRECVRLSDATDQPIATGLGRDLVLVPSTMLESMDEESVGDVLVHELSHVVRHDVRLGLVQRCASIAFWPHPFIHFLSHELTRAREELCDNHVLQDAPRERYARSLLKIAEQAGSNASPVVTASFLGVAWPLGRRVEDLLDDRRLTMTRPALAIRGVAGAAAAFVIFAVIAVGFEPAQADDAVQPTKAQLDAAAGDDGDQAAKKEKDKRKPDKVPAWKPQTDAEKEIVKRLSSPSPQFELDSLPLEEALEFFGQITGLTFGFDLNPDVKKKALKAKCNVLLMGGPGSSLANALALVFRDVGLVYTVRDDKVTITVPERLGPGSARLHGTSREFMEQLGKSTVELGEIDSMPVRKVFQMITTVTKIPVVLDNRAIAAAKIELDPLTGRGSSQSTMRAVQMIAGRHKLVALPRFGVIYVTTPKEAKQLPWDGPADLREAGNPKSDFEPRDQ